jgi:hypothetical protein
MNPHVIRVAGKHTLLCAVLVLSASSCKAPSIDACPREYVPLNNIAMPQSPDEASDAYSALVKIGFVVDEEGRVRSPEILSELWRREGELESVPDSYNEALITAVEQLRYPAQRKPCKASTVLQGNVFGMDED